MGELDLSNAMNHKTTPGDRVEVMTGWDDAPLWDDNVRDNLKRQVKGRMSLSDTMLVLAVDSGMAYVLTSTGAMGWTYFESIRKPFE